jgi:hypothetical protein
MSTNNSGVTLLRALYKTGHEVLEGTMADVTDEMLHWQPPGIANSIGTNYAHIVTGEDGMLNGMVRGGAPLMASSWAGKIGMSEPPPSGDEIHAWSKRAKIDLAALRAYAQAVYAETDAGLAALTDADLNRPMDFSAMGFGQQPVSWAYGIMLANLNWHTGEIAALKGVQGKKGYPF